MITLRKLASLRDGTRRRKYPLLLQHFETEIKRGKSLNLIYFRSLLHMISEDEYYSSQVVLQIKKLDDELSTMQMPQILRACNTLRHLLLQAVDAEPGDWDFEDTPSVNRSQRVSGELFLYLDGIRSPFNVGSIFRSAESFGIKEIFLSQDTVSPEHQRAKRSSMGCVDYIPWSFKSIDKLSGAIFALELGGKSLDSFPFPQEGTLIIGSEELGVSPEGIKMADNSLGRVSIKTGGIKGSINVSVATGIALHKWFSILW